MFKSFITKSFILSTTQLCSRIMSFVFIVIIAKYLGSEQFGIYIFCYTLILLLLFINDFGLSTIIVREISHNKSCTLSIINKSLKIRLLLSILLYLGLLIYANSIFDYNLVKAKMLIILGTLLFVKLFFDIYLSYFQAIEEQGIYGLLLFLNNFLMLIFTGVLIFFQLSLIYFTFVPILSTIIPTIISYYIYKKNIRYKIYNEEFYFNELIVDLLTFGVTLVLLAILPKISLLMLSSITDDISVGKFGLISRVIESLTLIPFVVNKMVFPRFSKYNYNNNRLENISIYSIHFLISISIYIIAFIFFYGKSIFVFIFGPEYVSSYELLVVMMWSIIFLFPNYIFGHLLLSMRKQNAVFIITAVTLFFTIILNYILIINYDVLGVAYAFSISNLIAFLAYLIVLKKYFNINKLLLIPTKGIVISMLIIFFGNQVKGILFFPIHALFIFFVSGFLIVLAGIINSNMIKGFKKHIIK